MVKMQFIQTISLLFFLIISNTASAASVEKQADMLANFVTKCARIIGGEEKVGVNVVMDWKSNTEITEISSFGEDQRTAAIETIIGYLGENEKKIFSDINSSDHAVMFVATRLTALEYIRTLVTDSKNDIVIKDYLDSEIADLKMMLNGTVDYGAIYINARKIRDDKRAMFLYQNEEFVIEKVTLMMKKPNIANILANKTSLISLFQVCAAIPESCAKI